MDQKIREIDSLVRAYLHKSKKEVKIMYGIPTDKSEEDIWYYLRYKHLIFKKEVVFIFEKERVIDIIIFEYVFWILVRDIFFNENHSPRYEIVKHY